jgi:hypothetical protein
MLRIYRRLSRAFVNARAINFREATVSVVYGERFNPGHRADQARRLACDRFVQARELCCGEMTRGQGGVYTADTLIR